MFETVFYTVAGWLPEGPVLGALAFGAYFIGAGCACTHLLIEED